MQHEKKNLFQLLIWKVKFWVLKQKCDQLHAIDGKQYFIVPSEKNGKVKLKIINNQTHFAYNKACKKRGIRTMPYSTLLEIALYKTKVGSITR